MDHPIPPTSAQVRAARALLGWSQPQVAEHAGMSTMTLKRAEGTGKPAASTESMMRLKGTFEAHGIIFVEANSEGPGVRLRKSENLRT